MIRLLVPGHLAYRELATRAVATACKLARHRANGSDVELPEEFTHEVVSAIGEAFNNVVLHAYADGAAGDIIIEIRTLDDRMEFEVQDFGAGFNPDDAPIPDLENLPESGMGLFIIRAFVDDLSYRPGSPNALMMMKRFPLK